MIKNFGFLFLYVPFLIMGCEKPIEAPIEVDTDFGLKKIPVEDAAIATFVLPGFPDFLIADDSAVWVTNIGRLDKLTLGTDTPVASVTMPSPCGAGIAAFGSIWQASCASKSINRIDKNTATITATISTGLADPFGELSLATGAGSVWVLSKNTGILSRIDPNTNTVTNQIQVKEKSYAAAFGFDAVWVSNSSAFTAFGSVQRIDPATNKVVATISAGHAPHFIAAGEGGVWVLNQGDGTVTRIDPVSNTAVATIHCKAIGPGGDITTGAGSVWIRASNAFLIEIDPSTNKVANIFLPEQGSGAVRVTDGNYIWASAHDVKTVWVYQK